MSTRGPASLRFSLTMNEPYRRPAHATDRGGPAVFDANIGAFCLRPRSTPRCDSRQTLTIQDRDTRHRGLLRPPQAATRRRRRLAFCIGMRETFVTPDHRRPLLECGAVPGAVAALARRTLPAPTPSDHASP